MGALIMNQIKSRPKLLLGWGQLFLSLVLVLSHLLAFGFGDETGGFGLCQKAIFIWHFHWILHKRALWFQTIHQEKDGMSLSCYAQVNWFWTTHGGEGGKKRNGALKFMWRLPDIDSNTPVTHSCLFPPIFSPSTSQSGHLSNCRFKGQQANNLKFRRNCRRKCVWVEQKHEYTP